MFILFCSTHRFQNWCLKHLKFRKIHTFTFTSITGWLVGNKNSSLDYSFNILNKLIRFLDLNHHLAILRVCDQTLGWWKMWPFQTQRLVVDWWPPTIGKNLSGALVDLDLVVQMEPHNVVALSSRGDTKRMLHDAGAQNMFVFFFTSGFLRCFFLCLFVQFHLFFV